MYSTFDVPHLHHIFKITSGEITSLAEGPIFLDVAPFQNYRFGSVLRIILASTVTSTKSQFFVSRIGICRPSIADVSEAILIYHSQAR